jgi:hypothetical protein
MKLRRLLPIAAASLLTTSCESSKQPKIFSGTTNSWYSVAASQTPFYRHGPQQETGPTSTAPRFDHESDWPSFGYVKVQLQDGENGYVANEDIRPALTPEPKRAPRPELPPPSTVAEQGEQFQPKSDDPRLIPPAEPLPEASPLPEFRY